MAQKGIIKDTVEGSQIEAKDFASIINALLGNGSGIIDYRNNLAATVISNNLIRLKDGLYSLKGHALYIKEETTIDLAIESGTLGMNRIDAIVATYQKNGVSPGTDLLVFEVVRGEPSASTAIAPEIVTGDINGTALKRQELLYLVKIEGTSIKDVELIADIFKNLSEVKEELDYLMMMDLGGTIVEY